MVIRMSIHVDQKKQNFHKANIFKYFTKYQNTELFEIIFLGS